MSKYNTKTEGINLTVNHEGAKAYKISAEMELYSIACTSMLADKFYESEKSQLKRIQSLITQVPHEFTAKLAVYCREQMYLRTIPIVLVVELAKITRGNQLVSRTVERIIQRADEITEVLAYYQKANSRSGIKKLGKLSNQIKKGVGKAFNKFNEYQLAKYDREGDITLKDALFISHPKAKDEKQQEIFNNLVTGKLETPYTWETELSALGQQKFESEEAREEAFRKKWEELIDSTKLGYMALLRNIRNILDAKVSVEHIKKVSDRLSNPDQVHKSKQFPFRFFSAFRELQENKNLRTDVILEALEKAAKISIDNVPGLDCDVLIAGDVSGSMSSTVSPKSKVMMQDIALVLGTLLRTKCEANIFGVFGEEWKVKRGNTDKPLQFVTDYRNDVGHATNGWRIIDWMIQEKVKVDKVFIFTDLQLWDSSGWGTGREISTYWNRYKKDINPEAEIYLFDLCGYGNTPVNTKQKGVYLIAGWSEKIFKMLESLKKGESVIDEINAIEL